MSTTTPTGDADEAERTRIEDLLDPDNLEARLYEAKERVRGLDKIRAETGRADSHTLGENMRRHLGMKRFRGVLEDLERQDHPDPDRDEGHPIIEHPRGFLDCLIKLDEVDQLRLEVGDYSGLPKERKAVLEWLADHPEILRDLRTGGTDFLAHGEMGSGKTTFGETWVARDLEVNYSAGVWRGSPARTEWLPLRAWTTVCLPSGVEAVAELDPPADDMDRIEVDLERAVRKVVRYDDLDDLNRNVLEEGAFHVVYPDPLFRGCEEATRRASEVVPMEYRSHLDELEGDDPTPTVMWWFAWAIHNIEFGPPFKTSWYCDEVGNVMPQGASNDYHDHHDRIRKGLVSKYVDGRRSNFSIHSFGHDPEDVDDALRKKQRWRVTMNGEDLPTSGTVTGMGSPPMDRNITKYQELGEAVMWSSQHYAAFNWDDIPSEWKVIGQLKVRYPGIEAEEVAA